jgi:N6-L-threonylcarbamoyladenine synthase
MIILGIESSCDDTGIAIIKNGNKILANVTASQTQMHEKYGGIIPEMASREHFLTIIPTIKEALYQSNMALQDLDAISVTNGPGLAGSLLIGVNAAKGLAISLDKPLIGINHLEGHIYSSWLNNVYPDKEIGFPLLCLIASGGHTELVFMEDHMNYVVIAKTRDDAAGEAFDKTARVLGLGFPGGPEIEKTAKLATGNMNPFPRPQIKNSLDFSFSGLKTAVVNKAIEDKIYPHTKINSPSVTLQSEYSYQFQEAIIDCLIRNIKTAITQYNPKGLLLGGGVAANSRLRSKMVSSLKIPVRAPVPSLCTDNGAMIAAAAFYRINTFGISSDLNMDVTPNLQLI